MPYKIAKLNSRSFCFSVGSKLYDTPEAAKRSVSEAGTYKINSWTKDGGWVDGEPFEVKASEVIRKAKPKAFSKLANSPINGVPR